MKILVTGGAGYLGSILVPMLLKKNHDVNVIDLFIFGEDVLDNHKKLKIFKGDIRNVKLLNQALVGCEVVIHLACISNDPSFELNPNLGKSINFDSFKPMIIASIKAGVNKFIYASSSSVYGIKKDKNVTEDMKLSPLTDYSKYKAECEKILLQYKSENFITTSVRSATLCGYSRRQRLDLIVNIFANQAFNNKKMHVFGGDQLRPNIHINDVAEFYIFLTEYKGSDINGEVYNIGLQNYPILEIAQMVKKELGEDVEIIKEPSEDLRSYHISSEKVKKTLNFNAKFTLNDAVKDLKKAFEKKLLIKPLDNEYYFNIKRMKNLQLK